MKFNENNITIWQYPLTETFSSFWDILSHNEQVRASNFYFSKHKRRFVVAHAVLRLILSKYINNDIKAQDLVFDNYKKGKPYLVDFPDLTFNLSHSEDLALLAIGKKHSLGIDLEFFSERPYQGIADKMFSSIENGFLKNINNNMLSLGFFHIWTQKEAVVKAEGIGLNELTHEFCVPLFKDTEFVTNKLQTNEKIIFAYDKFWKIISFMPAIACMGALCYNRCVTNINYIKLTKSDYANIQRFK